MLELRGLGAVGSSRVLGGFLPLGAPMERVSLRAGLARYP